MLLSSNAVLRRRRDPASGAVRPVGVLVAVITAGVVFGVGMWILPPIEPPPPVPVEPPPAPLSAPPSQPPPAPEPAAVDSEAPSDAGAPSRDGEPQATAPAEPEREEPKTEPRAKPRLDGAPATEEPAPASAKPAASAPRERSADKEVARDAWRKNLPDVSAEPGKAAILIPIKGSLEGATYHVTAKPRSVLIMLPKGESMITMPFYGVRHDGFRQLWIKKDDQAGTSIRVVLADAGEPQVEIKDEFVRVTVRRPAPMPPAAPESVPPPSTTTAAPARDAAAVRPTPGGD
jgi:hypothetical protein